MSEFPELEAYRRGPSGEIDRFLGVWIEIIVAGNQQRTWSQVKRARKTVTALLGRRQVEAVLAAGGEEALAESLRDAARVYFETCQSDGQYGSLLFGTKRLNAAQVRAKAAGEVASAVGILGDSGVLSGFAARLPRLLVDGFLEAFDDDAAADLRAAVARSESATKVAPLLW